MKARNLCTFTIAACGGMAGTVILRFTGDANRYLNSTAAIQELVKGALEATIRLHSNKPTTVDYEIDGEIVEEWDA